MLALLVGRASARENTAGRFVKRYFGFLKTPGTPSLSCCSVSLVIFFALAKGAKRQTPFVVFAQ